MTTEAPPAETETTEEATDTEAPKAEDPSKLQAEVEKWKALSRQHEERAKANAEAAKRIQELEDAQKTEAEKLQDKITRAEARADKAEAENTRMRVALATGLTLDLADRLRGDTEEELMEDAVELRKMLGLEEGEEEEEQEEATDTEAPSATRTPRPKLKSGGQGSYGVGNDDALTRDLKKKLGIK